MQTVTTTPHRARPLTLGALALTLSGLLAACGGGGGDAPGPSIDPTQLKGRWVTAAGVAPAVTAVVVPDGAGTAIAWLLQQDATRLVKLVVRGDGSAIGKSYALGQTTTTGQGVTGQVTAALTANPKSMAFTGVNASVLNLTQTDALTAAAVQADAAGTWSATSGGNAQTTQWTVAPTGTVAGSSTTGCTYAGGITAMAGTAAYSAQINESCPDGAKTTFGGIATLNASKTGLTVVLTSADETRAAAVFFSK